MKISAVRYPRTKCNDLHYGIKVSEGPAPRPYVRYMRFKTANSPDTLDNI